MSQYAIKFEVRKTEKFVIDSDSMDHAVVWAQQQRKLASQQPETFEYEIVSIERERD